MKDKAETLLGWICVIGILWLAFQPQTYVFPDEAQAALITDDAGTILRPEQNWDNRNFLKARNLRVIVRGGGCPGAPEYSCVKYAEPEVIYLNDGLSYFNGTRQFSFYHEYAHVLQLTGRLSLLWINDEVTADLYASCAMRLDRPWGPYLLDQAPNFSVRAYRAVCARLHTTIRSARL